MVRAVFTAFSFALLRNITGRYKYIDKAKKTR